MRSFPIAASFALLVAAGAAGAQEAGSVSVGAGVSTLGLGAEAGYRFNDRFGLRGGANYFTWSTSREVDDVDYDADLRLASGGLVADYYPFGGGFRLSAGARLNGNELDLTATPSAPVTIGGQLYNPAQIGRIDGSVEFNRIAPYVGLGYDAQVSEAFSVSFEAGALYQGSPDVSLRSESPLVSQSDLDREAQEIEDDLKPFQFYPVISVTAKYRF